jgi:glycosyltransferase involved in cell wall biosynthesis
LPVTHDTPARLSIVVPTYNERDRLPLLVEAVFSAYAAESLDAELVIVDDNSPDGTGAIADALAQNIASPCCIGPASSGWARPSSRGSRPPPRRSSG